MLKAVSKTGGLGEHVVVPLLQLVPEDIIDSVIRGIVVLSMGYIVGGKGKPTTGVSVSSAPACVSWHSTAAVIRSPS